MNGSSRTPIALINSLHNSINLSQCLFVKKTNVCEHREHRSVVLKTPDIMIKVLCCILLFEVLLANGKVWQFNLLKSSIMHIIELNADICSYNRYNKIVVKNVFVENGVLRYVNMLILRI